MRGTADGADGADGADDGGCGGGSGEEVGAPPSQPEVIGTDGNFDVCSVCGQGGELFCCEACPQAYHAECLGELAPADDGNESWFCPPCAEQLAMASAGAPGG